MKQNILVILPHPDDEAFGISGTLASYAYDGANITYACLTLGEMGRNMGVPPFATRVTLPQIRQKELEASCAAIGIADLRMMGYHDKTIEFEDQNKLDSDIKSLIEDIEPTLVITFYPGYAVHPDHDATGASVIRTIQKMPATERPVVHCIAFSKNHEQEIGKPDIINHISDFLKNKIEAISAHRSQFQIAKQLGQVDYTDQELKSKFGVERFWTYKFE